MRNIKLNKMLPKVVLMTIITLKLVGNINIANIHL
jgi:hypothetical protein